MLGVELGLGETIVRNEGHGQDHSFCIGVCPWTFDKFRDPWWDDDYDDLYHSGRHLHCLGRLVAKERGDFQDSQRRVVSVEPDIACVKIPAEIAGMIPLWIAGEKEGNDLCDEMKAFCRAMGYPPEKDSEDGKVFCAVSLWVYLQRNRLLQFADHLRILNGRQNFDFPEIIENLRSMKKLGMLTGENKFSVPGLI